MATQIISQQITVAGLPLSIWCTETARESQRPICAIFLLHGRMGSAAESEPRVKTILRGVYREAEGLRQDLFLVTFVLPSLQVGIGTPPLTNNGIQDHRNHGHRMTDERANHDWSRANGEEHFNARHALDMYSIQSGTANDVSFLIDFLPPYLFPSGERVINTWGAAGISLGGHSTWMTLGQDPRLTVGIPIIGCPSFEKLLSNRAKKQNIPFSPPYIPTSFLEMLHTRDPVMSRPYHSMEPANPFLGKKILVLSGADDPLVPWDFSADFVDRLEVGSSGIKQVVVEAGAGHECTDTMLTQVAEFLKRHVLSL